MRAFGEAFYGRVAAYDHALTEGEEALAQSLSKNILNGGQVEKARRLAIYAESAIAVLAELDEAVLLRPSWKFPAPTLMASGDELK
jgi:cytochrome b pre-mRNA-processing protein 3